MISTLTALALLQDGAPAGPPGGMLGQFLPILLIFGIFYLLLIAPMRKKQKAHQQMLEGLKRGDKVITNGGLHGEVAAIDGGTVLVKLADQVKVRVSKSAVAAMQGGEADGDSASKGSK